MKKTSFLLLSGLWVLSACQSAQAIPTPSNEQVAAAIIEKKATIEAGYTHTPVPPTATSIPPTETPTATAVPATFTATIAPTETHTPIPPIVIEGAPTRVALPAHYYGKTALLKIENNSGERITLYLTGVAYYQLVLTTDQKITDAPWGDYYYRVYIGEDGPYVGSFFISNIDKHTLVIEKNKVHFVGP